MAPREPAFGSAGPRRAAWRRGCPCRHAPPCPAPSRSDRVQVRRMSARPGDRWRRRRRTGAVIAPAPGAAGWSEAGARTWAGLCSADRRWPWRGCAGRRWLAKAVAMGGGGLLWPDVTGTDHLSLVLWLFAIRYFCSLGNSVRKWCVWRIRDACPALQAASTTYYPVEFASAATIATWSCRPWVALHILPPQQLWNPESGNWKLGTGCSVLATRIGSRLYWTWLRVWNGFQLASSIRFGFQSSCCTFAEPTPSARPFFSVCGCVWTANRRNRH